LTKKSKNFIIGLSKFFSKKEEKTMRVLAINDISCVGKCSLSVSLPIISACGVTCDVLPTALLSTHTGGFQGYTFLDLTDEMQKTLAHWETLGISFDFIYSGYLGSIRQIETVLSIKDKFLKKGGKFIVDPVMGDGGKLYAGFDNAYVEKMKTLCRAADYILPNATESCLLADLPYGYQGADIGEQLITKLKTLCPHPIATGIAHDQKISVYYTNGEKIEYYTHANVEGFFCGAGDVFASAFVGALAKGKNDADAIKLAADFTTAAILRSASEVADKRYGLNFEAEIFGFLKKLND
jgi:pyridoxine kinase